MTITLEVNKPDGAVGHLVIGPMRMHQRCIFGRAPSCDVVLEHLSISRQHASLAVDGTGTVMVTDLQSGELGVGRPMCRGAVRYTCTGVPHMNVACMDATSRVGKSSKCECHQPHTLCSCGAVTDAGHVQCNMP